MNPIQRVFAGLFVALMVLPELQAEGNGYAGSKACASCHLKIYETYISTGMGRSISVPDAKWLPAPVTIHSEAVRRDFRIFGKDGALYQSESQGGVFDDEHRLAYAIGSGANGISFAVRRGDYLFQAPLSFYSRTKAWNLSPGFERADEGFRRPIYDACIVCHSGQPQVVPGRDGLYRDPPFQELAIGCENCHGPGAGHIQARSRGAAEPAGVAIVNPARLPPRIAEDICMRCHQGGDARVLLPGKQYSDFRPGTPLLRTVAIFALPSSFRNGDLLQHHAAMKLSRCFRASGGKLSCMTCHNPHEQPDEARAPAYYRARCLGCHTESSCGVPLTTRKEQPSPDNCIGCHMPKRSVEMISHSELTNHRIPAKPDAPSESPQPGEDLPGLVLLNASPAEPPLPSVTLLSAYGELMGRDPSFQPRYLETLQQAARTAPDDPLVLAALGRKALAENRPDAAELLTRAEQRGATGITTFIDLSEALARAGQQAESSAALERGEKLFPYSSDLRKHLILAYIRMKAYGKARVLLERYVEDFPEDDFMRGLLGKVRSSAAK